MTTGASLLLAEELARLDDRAPAGRASAMRNELMRTEWRRLRTETSSSNPANRLRRRLRSA